MGEHGKGTTVPVTTTRKDGTIRQRVRVAVTMADGRRVWRTARDADHAERIRQELVDARERDLNPTTQTLGDFLRGWIAAQRSAKRRRVRERTLIGYERIIEQRIIPELGKVKLAALSRRRIQAWLDQQPGSAGTVRNDHAVLRKALASLVGDVLPNNPAIGVELPDRDEFAGSPLTAEEAHRLLEATADTRLGVLWRLAIVTGLRQGELLGLPRDALEGTTLTVAHQLQRIGGRWVLAPPKAARAMTRIALDKETARLVRAHLAKMAAERQPGWRYHGLMFVTERGEPYHQSTILAEFRRACAAAGIAERRFHDLRGTSATILRDLGVPEDTRMARLGHSTTTMARHYGKASRAQDEAAVRRLAKAIDR